MKLVKLGDVARINPTWDKAIQLDDPVSFVGMASMSDEAGKTINEEPRTVSQVRKGFTPFRRDDLLVAKITPCFENGKIGRAAIQNDLGAGSTEFHVVRPGEKLDAGYALHFLRRPAFRAAGELRMTGSGGQRRVPTSYVADTMIPLPPLDEQRRIAAILDKADELRAERREALAHLDTLPQSIFHSMFGDPTKTVEWPRQPLRDVTSKVGSGATPRGGKNAYKGTEVALIRSMNVRDGELLLKDLAFIDDDQARALQVVTVKGNDVLLNITGASVARVCRAPKTVIPARVNQHVCIIRPTPDVTPEYLERALLAPAMKAKLLGIAGSGATREAITKQQILALDVPIPPLDLQQTFVARVAVVERLIELHRKHLAELDSLFASLQHRAFKGEL